MMYISIIHQTTDSCHMYSEEETGIDVTILHRQKIETTGTMTCHAESPINEMTALQDQDCQSR